MAGKKVCDACALRSQCTQAKWGRGLLRHNHKVKVDAARRQSFSREAITDRQRRRHLMEGSFADAANNHGFKRSRWRRLWRQRIQNGLIAACQNIRILIKWGRGKTESGQATMAQIARDITRTFFCPWSRTLGKNPDPAL
jgi:hypothetical protein